MSPSPECPYAPVPLTHACGDGTCISALACSCPAGYTGAGDFVLGEPSCIINMQAVAVLWAICAAAWIIVGVFAAYCLVLLVKQPPKVSRKRKLFFGLLVELGAFCFGYVGISRAMDPVGTAIGTHQATTVAFGFGAMAFWLSSIIFTYSFIFVLVRQTKMKGASYVHKVQRLQWQLELAFPVLGTLIVVVAGAVPMAMLAVDKTVADNRWQMYGLALAHYIGLASTIFLIGLVIVPVLLKPVIKDLNEVVSADIPMSPHAGASGRSDQVRTVLRKFDVFLAQLRHESILNLGLAVLMGLWPLLQMASSYFLPIAWMSSFPVTIMALHTNIPVRQGASSTSASGPTAPKSADHHSSSVGGQSSFQSVIVGGTFRESQKLVIAHVEPERDREP